MKQVAYSIFLAVLVFLSGCGVTNVPLTVRRAPKISFSDTLTNVLVINRFDANKVDFVLRKEKKKEVYNRGINAEIAELLNEFENIKGINLIKKSDSLTLVRDIKANLDSTVLTVGEIKQLATQYGADYILALENYAAKFVQEEVIKTKNTDGSASKTAKYSLAIESTWVLYDNVGNLFRELNGNAAQYHSERAVVSGLLAIGPALGSNTKFVEDVSIQAGRGVAGYFKTQILSVNRPLYTDKILKATADAIKNGDYNVAREQLKILAKDANATIAAKAYYNLAVIAELEGNKTSAIDFALLSLQKKKSIYASFLLNGLKYGG